MVAMNFVTPQVCIGKGKRAKFMKTLVYFPYFIYVRFSDVLWKLGINTLESITFIDGTYLVCYNNFS